MKIFTCGMALLLGMSAMCCSAQDAAPALMGAATPYSWLEGQTPLFGTPVSGKWLQGRVVVVFRFGANCGACKAIMPEIVKLQTQLLKSGGCVIGSYCQEWNKEAQDYISSAKINFPVYLQLQIPMSQPSNGIPDATILNRSGEIAIEGHPAKIGSEMPKLLSEAPPIVETTRTTPYANIRNPLMGENLGSAFKAATAMFMPGKPWAKGCKTLEKMAKKDKENGDMATEILSMVTSYAESTFKKLEEISEDRPAEALSSLTILSKSTKGMEIGKDVTNLTSELTKKNKSIKELASLLTAVGNYDASFDNLKETAQQKTGKQLVNKLKKFSERKGLDESLVAEADTAIAAVEALMEGNAPALDEGAIETTTTKKEKAPSARKTKKADAEDADAEDADAEDIFSKASKEEDAKDKQKKTKRSSTRSRKAKAAAEDEE